jgi:hypothetical protein
MKLTDAGRKVSGGGIDPDKFVGRRDGRFNPTCWPLLLHVRVPNFADQFRKTRLSDANKNRS